MNVELMTRLKSKTGISVSGCWEWRGALDSCGYARINYMRRNWKASRVMWIAKHDLLPNEMHVLHKCDNRKCVNPDHLFIGTNAQNMADMVSKGRSPRARAKLKAAEVLAIRSKSKLPLSDLANEYAVAQSTIYQIISGRTWRHL